MTNCLAIEKGTQMKKYPSCLEQTYYVLINNSKIERGKLTLFIGIGKYNENI